MMTDNNNSNEIVSTWEVLSAEHSHTSTDSLLIHLTTDSHMPKKIFERID